MTQAALALSMNAVAAQRVHFATHLASLSDHDLHRLGESYAHNMTKGQLFSLLCELEARLRHQEWKEGEA